MAPGSHSLKEKRAVLRRIKDRTRDKFHIAVAEVGAQDLWQRAVLGFAVVGGDRAHVESMVQSVVGFIDGLQVAAIVDVERDFIHYGDGPIERAGGSAGDEG